MAFYKADDLQRVFLVIILALVTVFMATAQADATVRAYAVPAGAHPHDVAPHPQGSVVWYTAQHQGALGRLEPDTGSVE
jgi:virginiamycin B lyase